MISLLLFNILTFDTILNIPELKNAHYGICILDLENDSIVYDYNGEKVFIPASNMKIITTAAALYFLGKNFQYRTLLYLRGKIHGKKLHGDIILQGGGDPYFSIKDMERFVDKIRKLDIDEITGGILIIDDYFTSERLPVGWAWHYLDAKYAPEISALSFNKNVVSVRIRPSNIGDIAPVSIYPSTCYVKLVNSIKTTANSENLIIFRKPEENVIIVEGTIKNARDIDIAVKDPALFAGEYLKERLSAIGIKINAQVKRIRSYEIFIAQESPVILDSALSPMLLEMIKETNTESENLYAEILLKTLGAEIYKEGSFSAGLNVLKNFLQICGVDTSSVSIWDGSGLSKYNLLSPRAFNSVLKFMYNSDLFRDFYNSLPCPGEGTLKARFNGFPDTLRAKTGAIHAASCLSGYLKINEKYYAFSMLFNNFTCPIKKITQVHEKILRSFIEECRKYTQDIKFLNPQEVFNND
ncbi:MAG: D-alanyl-D-alanine carboxypeptidase/D-alanyl-D-alanine-endopeptidase [candidate division WOR-3 bacterium]|nr:D-alanyl-D-alanine carboxypeptidase/D-alanyl-D-alanine-endopeptidase [candidate division WOR-3 bacterium]